MGITSLPSTITTFPMPSEVMKQNREVVIAEEIGHGRVLTLNRPNNLNYVSEKVALTLGQKLEKYEKDDNAKFVILKGAGRTFSAGGDLERIYDARDSVLEGVYRIYWLFYHIHTYKKPHIALVHGMSMGGGVGLMTPMKFSVITEKTVREYLGLTGAKLKGKEVVAAGLATHFVPSHKLFQLEKSLLTINNGEEDTIFRSVIDELSTNVQIDETSVLSKLSIIDDCFSRETVEEILDSLEAEASKKENDWIMPVLKKYKESISNWIENNIEIDTRRKDPNPI
ncbi:hypothetical protein RDI58_018157 [Solanum bulbocastanum]|uniref:3-hydroxyisobutyryl-CoA hydrolase n=1 Tax=Solanum bulbocastanum TaxID=147425 RepID=A0AAN8TGS0_SOLBU